MGDCLWTSKLSQHITNTQASSAFHPSEAGKHPGQLSLSPLLGR